MAITQFTVKKNVPTEAEDNGEYVCGTVLHNQIFTNCKLEIIGKVAKLTNEDNVIEAVFSLDQFSILK